MRSFLLLLCVVACVKKEFGSTSTVEDGPPGGGDGNAAGADSGMQDGVSPDDTDTDTGDASEPLDDIDENSLPAGLEPCRNPVKGEVLDVTDGDTIKVQTGRGVERVRLIGIDTPEVDHSGPDDECYGEESKGFLTDRLKGKTVWLTFDRECEDVYDRTLAYVHRGEEEADFIQRLLFKGGWALSCAVSPNVSFRSTFEMDESDARSAGLGIWGECR